MFFIKRSVAVVVDECLQGDVSGEPLSGWPRVRLLVGSPGEMDDREGAVVGVEYDAVAS